MEAYTLNNGTDKLRFADIKADIEEHSSCVRVLKRTAVAVKPRGENNSAAACGDFVDYL